MVHFFMVSPSKPRMKMLTLHHSIHKTAEEEVFATRHCMVGLGFCLEKTREIYLLVRKRSIKV